VTLAARSSLATVALTVGAAVRRVDMGRIEAWSRTEDSREKFRTFAEELARRRRSRRGAGPGRH